MKEDNKYVAVFIDAENISSRNAEQIFNEASNYGEIIVKRIFGDWSHNNLALSWKEAISKYSIKAEQQFSFVSGKNTSDISLIIQAMIALFEKDIDVFCLVSSDSDFTYLVQEMREREKVVVGMGARTSPQAFVNAFSEFIYLGEEAVKPLEVAEIEKDKKEIIKVKKINKTVKTKEGIEIEEERLKTLKEIIESLIDKSGRALYSQISDEMKNKYSDFLPKNYGCRTLSQFINKFIKDLEDYDIAKDKDGTTMFLVKK
jgi:uncharacterized protein (TIGR00288 family)